MARRNIVNIMPDSENLVPEWNVWWMIMGQCLMRTNFGRKLPLVVSSPTTAIVRFQKLDHLSAHFLDVNDPICGVGEFSPNYTCFVTDFIASTRDKWVKEAKVWADVLYVWPLSYNCRFLYVNEMVKIVSFSIAKLPSMCSDSVTAKLTSLL